MIQLKSRKTLSDIVHELLYILGVTFQSLHLSIALKNLRDIIFFVFMYTYKSS